MEKKIAIFCEMIDYLRNLRKEFSKAFYELECYLDYLIEKKEGIKMNTKILLFDEILDYLKVSIKMLLAWDICYDEKLSKEINDLKSVFYYLEGYQDYLIEKSGEKL